MPRKPPRPPSDPDDSTAWRVILERIEAQNQMTYEAVNGRADALERRFDERFAQMDARFETIEHVVRGHSEAIQSLQAGQPRIETKVEAIDTRLQVVEKTVEKIDTRLEAVGTKVDLLVPLEARVTALERRRA